MRVKAVIAYDGSHYFGFQKQRSTNKTITSAVEIALRSLQIHSSITGSGRTDAGVHATGQIIHFDLPEYWKDLTKLKQNLNRKLQHIQFKYITQTDSNFHARFSAKKRVYRYIFKTQTPSVFEKSYISFYDNFDTQKLEEALACFQGEHDFIYFHKTGSPMHTSIRKIYQAYYIHRKEYHYIYFQANGFLRAQVRMMVAMAMQYAQGKITLNLLKAQLQGRYKQSTQLAPPEGLYLARIIY
ncbi:tRNA pseudouridine synthase A [hydrothermal vent metagenome]|uniref:tRNA pseudouridine synthase A n=1 Tax=hydrothermal vent metagenome TaxID=652676 RepID=A0A1W1CT63_9ZZZZ